VSSSDGLGKASSRPGVARIAVGLPPTVAGLSIAILSVSLHLTLQRGKDHTLPPAGPTACLTIGPTRSG